MIGQYSSNQIPSLLSPYGTGNTLPCIIAQNVGYNQMGQNMPNIFFSYPFGAVPYSYPQQQSQIPQYYMNGQQFVPSVPLIFNPSQQSFMTAALPAQSTIPNLFTQRQQDHMSLPQHQFPCEQNLINSEIIQISQRQVSQCNQNFLNNEQTKDTQFIEQQIQQEYQIKPQFQDTISNGKQQVNAFSLNQNLNRNFSENFQQSISEQKSQTKQILEINQEIADENSKKHLSPLIICKKNHKTSPFKEQSQFQDLILENKVKSVNMSQINSQNNNNNNNNNSNSNNSQEIVVNITSIKSSTKFKIFKQRKSISQENLSSTQRNSEEYCNQENFIQNNQENFVPKVQENTIHSNQDNHHSSRNEESIDNGESNENYQDEQQQKSIDNKSRNFSKNLLKSFFKYTQKENSNNKRFLFNFKRYISSNRTNNELIIKLMTNSPYHSYFVDYLGQPATNWILNSKVQNINEQKKFLELCRSGSISELKKRNHNKKKSLFTLRKQ